MTEKIVIDPVNIDYSLIKKVAGIIREGGIVALPTDTVYGLAGCIDKKSVIDRLYEIKVRAKNKPFSLAVHNVNKIIDNYFDFLPPFGYRLMEKFWPGALTIVYYSHGDDKIGIRVPSNAITNEVLAELNMPVYLPSANISGDKDAVSASEVESVFDGKIDLIVDGGDCIYSKPSTVLDLTLNPFKILREGIVSEQCIASVFVRKRIVFVCTGNSCRSPMAQLLLEKYLSQEVRYYQNRYEVISRGISAFSGCKASSSVVDILREKEGIDAADFHAQRLDRHTILSSDLIFTMEDIQQDYILEFEPSSEGRVFNLKKFLPPELEKDIPDPVGKGPQEYAKSYSLIKEAIMELKDWI